MATYTNSAAAIAAIFLLTGFMFVLLFGFFLLAVLGDDLLLDVGRDQLVMAEGASSTTNTPQGVPKEVIPISVEK